MKKRHLALGFAFTTFVAFGWACTLTRSLDQYEEGATDKDAGVDVKEAAPADAQDAQDAADAKGDTAAESNPPDVDPRDVYHSDVVDAADEPEVDAGCPTGMADCDDDESNGCETDLRTSLESCGECGVPCDLPGAEVDCIAGICRLTSCQGDTADCNGNLLDGCETDTLTSDAHCGDCAQACPPDHASSQGCSGGTCDFTCDEGFGDCDTDALNGCEINLTADPDHCGSCSNACTTTLANTHSTCEQVTTDAGGGYVCSWVCDDTFADCDLDVTSGCERSLNDPVTCGACNLACPANFDCLNRVCSCAHHEDCAYGDPEAHCNDNGATKVCVCGGTKCEAGEVCLTGAVCGPPP